MPPRPYMLSTTGRVLCGWRSICCRGSASMLWRKTCSEYSLAKAWRGVVYDCRVFFFFSSRRRHTRCSRDWSSDVCSSDLPEGYLGVVMEKLGPRRAELLDMRNPGVGMVRMRFKIPARGLLGYRSEFLTDTRGTGVMHHRFFDYGPWAGPLQGRSRGVLVADREGVAVGYALFNLQERGTMFVKPGDSVYEGMVVGENARVGDMDVNPSKEKKLTNMRTTASDEMIILEPPRTVR